MAERAGVRRRSARRVLPAVALVAVLAGCADMEGLHRDGAAASVSPPEPLWPHSVPAPPGPEQQRGRPFVVPGIAPVASGDLRDVDPLAVVKADLAATEREDQGTGRLVDRRAAERVANCARAADCGVREPVLRDLTGDGRAELITAVDIDGRASEMRVYHVVAGRVMRVFSRRAVLEGVELAAGHLAIREPTSNDRFVYVSHYGWDGSMMALIELKLDTCRAVKQTSGIPCASASASASASPSRSPSPGGAV
ncbi:hypothetical protein ACFW17_21860 [Streptomyces sp. NPDC058961]|uniref:hypothetical protein n=1 Tax=Streptomyces sp. NPDC058961 TaxID=3346680 RepID=UPI003688178D